MKALSWFAIAVSLLIGMPASSVGIQSAASAPEASKEEPVTEKGLRNLVFEAKHRDVGDLASAVRIFGSGIHGAALSFSREFRTITVRDLPENVAGIEAALKGWMSRSLPGRTWSFTSMSWWHPTRQQPPAASRKSSRAQSRP